MRILNKNYKSERKNLERKHKNSKGSLKTKEKSEKCNIRDLLGQNRGLFYVTFNLFERLSL
jgi:hypothetical protein